jgi:gluconolactonase
MRILADGLGFVEGPLVLGDRVLVCDGTAGVIAECTITTPSPAPGGPTESAARVVATPGGGPNALAHGADGRVYIAQFGGWTPATASVGPGVQSWSAQNGVCRVRPPGPVPMEHPNDLAFGPDGRLYLTDSGEGDFWAPTTSGRLLVLGPDGGDEVLLETGPTFPNGIAFMTEGDLIWSESATRRLRRRRGGRTETFARLPPGHVPDGIAIAADGRVFVATLESRNVTVLAPSGEIVDHLEVPGLPTNCALFPGGLVVTAITDPSGDPGTGFVGLIEVDVEPLPLNAGVL